MNEINFLRVGFFRIGGFPGLLLSGLVLVSTLSAATTEENLAVILQVNQKGENGPAAGRALQTLQQTATAEDLIPMLSAYSQANPLAANYLRNGVEAVAARLQQAETGLPQKELEQFIRDLNQHPTARKIAFDLLAGVDESARERLIPGMLYDPSAELRREAVQHAIEVAVTLKEKKSPGAKAAFEKALAGAVDNDQVQEIVKPLEELGVVVNLQQHFGFLNQWDLIGPFDNREKKGFPVAYPPESEIDLKATYAGKEDEVRWQQLTTEDEYGILDIAKDIGPYKGAIMYATTRFVSAQPQQVEARLGTPNAWKLWVNGKLVFAREEYQRGMALDQYRIPVRLQAGENRILLKLCQNEQEESWAQDFRFQFRICNAVGSAVLSEKP